MSMTVLTILQFMGAFGAYTLLVLILPSLALRRYLTGRKLPERLLYYFLAGNFYVINLVYLLQLLHISNVFTLVLGTVAPYVILAVRRRKGHMTELLEEINTVLRRLEYRQLGGKTLFRKAWDKCRKKIQDFFTAVFVWCYHNPLECLFLIGVFAALFYEYGVQKFIHYSYAASDVPVHTYWINYMDENKIFVAGVYPFGFHCMLHYIHVVFGMDIYVLMRVFSLVQVIYITLMLLAFLRLCCKSRYIPYGAVLFYTLVNLYHPDTYSRYYSTIPQEFGMVFILPTIYFAFLFLRDRRQELARGDVKKKESLTGLLGFAMGFSMSLSAHFYDTMIVGIYCVGIVVGFCMYVFRRRYFFNILCTGIISVLIAILPLGIAFATGTPLEGSLRWGMSIMNKGSEAVEQQEAQEYEEAQQKSRNTGEASTEEKESETEVIREDISGSFSALTAAGSAGTSAGASGLLNKVVSFNKATVDNINLYVFKEKIGKYKNIFWPLVCALLVFGILAGVLGEKDYSGIVISTAVYMAILTILLSAKHFGLPELMDAGRCSIYWAYSSPILLTFAVDGVLYLLSALMRVDERMSAISFLLTLGVVSELYLSGGIRAIRNVPFLVTNEAATCFSNIVREEQDYQWTICSANDETQMVYGHGRHEEIITFLQELENYNENSKVYIPTRNVYFFIEKVPVDYDGSYDGSGQCVSARGAMYDLPAESGLVHYSLMNRWIVMSKMYFWAQEFSRRFPNEMSVYFENENFVCYRLQQNTYRLLNLAIDYGYNGSD